MPINRINKLAERVPSSGANGAGASGRLTSGGRVDRSSAVSRRSMRLQRIETQGLNGSALFNPFDITIECVLAILLCFSAFAFGATQAWSQEVTLALCSALLLILAGKLAIQRSVDVVWSWAYVPIGLFIALVAMQSAPLPARWVGMLSPGAIALRSHLLGISPGTTTFSLYPLATRQQLQLPICASAVFIVVLNVYQRRAQVIRLLTTIAVVGGGVILLAAYQNISGSRLIYGIVPAIQANSGPFMNYGHFSQFTNLSLGAALGLLLFELERGLAGHSANIARIKALLSKGDSWRIWLLGCEIIIGAITVFLSMSRMGALSMISAATFTAVIISARGRTRGPGTLLLILAIVTFAGLLYVGFDSIYAHLATIRHVEEVAGGRWEILRDLRPAWAQFPLIGTGLGTHEFVFPMFDRSTITSLATYAENEYAQMLEEVGILGLAAIIFFLSIVLWNLVRLTWNPVHRLDTVAYGLFFGILAAMIHSFSDFGQHVPAIAYLTASVCALILVLNRIGNKGKPTQPIAKNQAVKTRGYWTLFPRWATVIAVLVGMFSLLSHADRARAAQANEDIVLGAEDGGSHAFNSTYQTAELFLLDHARQAAALEPDNVAFQLDYANHRWEAITAHSRSPNQNQLMLTAESVDAVREIVRDLKDARQACPTFGPLYSFGGELEKFVFKDPSGDIDIRKGADLTSYDANVCFLAGQLDASEKHWDLALARMHRAVDLSDSFRSRVVDTLAVEDQRPELALPFAAGHRDALIHLSELLGNDDRYRDLCGQLRDQALALLQAQCQASDASPSTLMELGDEYQNQKRTDAAIELYRRALTQDYGQVEWRLKLADALAKTDRSAEAIHEARICLQLRPALKTAEDLIAELSVRPGSAMDH